MNVFTVIIKKVYWNFSRSRYKKRAWKFDGHTTVVVLLYFLQKERP